jgi:hypothetical protein
MTEQAAQVSFTRYDIRNTIYELITKHNSSKNVPTIRQAETLITQ